MNESLRILKPYMRGLPLIILAMIVSVFAAKKYLSYVTPMYESTVKMKVADVAEGVPSSNLYKDFDVFANSNKIAAEIEVIKSQVLLTKALNEIDFDTEIYRVGKIRSVELYHNSPITIAFTEKSPEAYDKPFDLQLHDKQTYSLTLPGSKSPINGKIGDPLETDFGTLVILLNDQFISSSPNLRLADHYRFIFVSREKQVSLIAKNLDVSAVDKDVPVVRITYKSADPVKAAILTNKLAEVYIKDYIETKYKAANVTVNFLEEQIGNVVTRLTDAENQIQYFRDAEDIINVAQETETDLRKISQLKIQQTNLKMNLDAIIELENYIHDGKGRFLELAPNFEAFTDLLSTEIIKQIKTLQAEKKELLLTYTPENERVVVIDAKIEDLTSYLEESIRNTRKNLEVKYTDISNDIENAEKEFIGLPGKEKLLNILNREFQIYQDKYNFLNEKKIEAEIAQAAKMTFHRIISPAKVSSTPVSPNSTIIIILSAILGMAGAILLIFLVHHFKAKVNDVITIEKNSTIPIAMLTPFLKSKAMREKHFLKEALQIDIKGLLKQNGILCLSSFSRKDGAAFNALGLAEALARQGKKTLLLDVEGQMRNQSSIHVDMSELQENLLYDVMSDPAFNRYSRNMMIDYLEQHKSNFDAVIVLNESIDGGSKSLLFMSLADSNLVVLDSRKTPQKRIAETEFLKEDYNLPNMHFLLNRFAYNPGVIKEGIQLAKKGLRTLNAKSKRK